jgi:CRISPR-associated protein (TIGR03986 family)
MTGRVYSHGPGWAERDGGTLTGELSYRPDGKKPARRTWRPAKFDTALARWFAAAADHDRVEVIADVDSDGQVVQVRMASPPLVVPPEPDPARLDAVQRLGGLGGLANPYTFIPARPRTGVPAGLDNGPPPPHGVIDPGSQWSGWLVLRLTTATPLLLPDPGAVSKDEHEHPTYPVRTGPDGKPLLHGASVKGALRSAYEAVTGSRYGVFRGHDRPLAYRRPASSEDRPKSEPARVEADGKGRLVFRICDAIPVPLYDKPDGPPRRKAEAAGQARQLITRPGGDGWSGLHGRRVACLVQERGRGREMVTKVALADDETSLGGQGAARKHGWLSVTGHSIGNKTSERLFVSKSNSPVPVGEEHHQMWHAVLASYHDVAEQQASDGAEADTGLQRSRHIITEGKVPDRLADGDLVYLERDQRGEVTAISPVYIGRLPFQAAPADLLDESLLPAPSLDELSPADRLFGWAPPQAGPGRASASGYRGRLRVASARCDTGDWRTEFAAPGVTLAPLSTPEPTQFRFYGASDQDGSPIPAKTRKDQGYRHGSGLRGRKFYWYPSDVPGGYWTPGTGETAGQFREWQEPPDAAPSQTSSHLGWVREGAAFTVRLFIDAVPGPELGPLIWLATQDGCPLRLGAGKPLGFGAVTVSIDWHATELRTGQTLRDCWTTLRRPGPCPAGELRALADDFEQQARSSPALAPALEAFRKIARGLPGPAAYPRTRRAPEAETYRWFVANEKIKDGKPAYGFALPHVLEDDQRLPFINPDDD